jgi:hypothetical protein
VCLEVSWILAVRCHCCRPPAINAVLATHSLRVVPRHVTCRSFDTASKGQPDRNFTIYSDERSSLRYDFRVGREYIVFSRGNDSPEIAGLPRTAQVYLCSGTAELSSADGKRRLSEVRERLRPKG